MNDLNYTLSVTYYIPLAHYRSSRSEGFCKKGVLRIFAKFTGKHLYQSVFFNKIAGLSLQLYEKRDSDTCFPVNFAKFLRTPFLTERLWWLFWH